ncbi:GNAT family N-acetyltransferase [Paenibacillus xylanexedens]|uniref:GNAT family N-acetyltransferase n=1 Tax=Paenibacillus xylanexedens TaxID=528191 RepID=UPI003B021B2E
MLNYDDISKDYLKDIEKFKMLGSLDERNVEAYLKNYALDLHERQTAVTRLYFDKENKLVGFFSLHNDMVKISPHLAAENGWNLLTEEQAYFPSIKLHYLGVDARYRNQGHGTFLIDEVFSIAREIATSSGCNFISVEALHSSVWFYIGQGFKIDNRTDEFYNMLFPLEALDNPDLKETPYLSKKRIQEIRDQINSTFTQSGVNHEEIAASSELSEEILEQIEYGSEVNLEYLQLVCKALNIPFP